MTAFLQNRWMIVSIILTCWALIATLSAGSYWLRYNDLLSRISGVLIEIDIGVDYGNGTRAWHNTTKTLTGATLFDVTKQAFNVTYQTGLLGTEVISINGVKKEGAFGWTYWLWNGTDGSWTIIWAGADEYRVMNGDAIMWYYQDSFNPPS